MQKSSAFLSLHQKDLSCVNSFWFVFYCIFLFWHFSEELFSFYQTFSQMSSSIFCHIVRFFEKSFKSAQTTPPDRLERALPSFYHSFLPVSTPPPPKIFHFSVTASFCSPPRHKNKKICNNRRKIFTSRGNRAHSISARRENTTTARRGVIEPPLCKGRCRAARGGGIVASLRVCGASPLPEEGDITSPNAARL